MDPDRQRQKLYRYEEEKMKIWQASGQLNQFCLQDHTCAI
jgi:hypothetical protein